MIKITNIPSLVEATYGGLELLSHDLLNGLKIKNDKQWFIIGELAKNNGINPQKIINATPEDRDYQLLFKAAMLAVHDKVRQPLHLTLGLPFSNYRIYRKQLAEFLDRRHFSVEYTTETYKPEGTIEKFNFEIDKYHIISELEAGVIGIRNLYPKSQSQNFMILSLGYGTVEGGVATRDGLLERTCFSTHGLRYAVGNLQKELNKNYYLELKNEFQLNDSLVKGSITSKRKKIDLTDFRRELLTQYYKQVISPAIRNNITDRDFESCECIYIVGGGINFADLRNAFSEEFKDVMRVEPPSEESQNIASIGYLLNSLQHGGPEVRKNCVGLDLGNSSTIISYFED